MTRALIWGLWQRGRWHLLALSAGLTIFVALVLSVIRPDDPTDRANLAHGMLGLVIVCLAIDLLYLAEGKMGEGFDGRLFVLPVSSRRLAATWLAFLVGALWIAYGAGGLALSWWLDVPLPGAGGALLVAAFVASFTCSIWATPQRPVTRGIASLLLGAAWTVPVLLRRQPGAAWDPAGVLAPSGPTGWAALALMLTLAFPLGTWALARHRRGDGVPAARAERRRHEHRETSAPRRPFTHAISALLWLDTREKGLTAPALFAAPWLFLGLAAGTGALDEGAVRSFLPALVQSALFFGPVLVAGIVCRTEGGAVGARIDHLRTLRPVSCSRLAAVYLAHGGAQLAAGWAATALAAWIALRASGLDLVAVAPPVGRLLALPDAVTWLLLGGAGLLVVGWIQLGSLSAILLTGRSSVSAFSILLPYAAAGALLFYRDRLDRLPIASWLELAPWLIGGLGVTATAAAVILAHRWHLLRARAVGWQALAVMAVSGLLAARFGLPRADLAAAAIGVGAAMLLPWPATTLAIFWNRHR